MKCTKCNHEIKEGDKFCPNCGAKIKPQSSFSKKLEAENKANEHQKKMAEKELDRQNKIIKEKGLNNNLVYVSLAFGIIGTAFALWPAGHMAQVQWWYTICTLGSGILGYFFAIKANKKNREYLQRYRVIVHPKMMKAAIYLSAFATFAGTIYAFSAYVYHTGGI